MGKKNRFDSIINYEEGPQLGAVPKTKGPAAQSVAWAGSADLAKKQLKSIEDQRKDQLARKKDESVGTSLASESEVNNVAPVSEQSIEETSYQRRQIDNHNLGYKEQEMLYMNSVTAYVLEDEKKIIVHVQKWLDFLSCDVILLRDEKGRQLTTGNFLVYNKRLREEVKSVGKENAKELERIRRDMESQIRNIQIEGYENLSEYPIVYKLGF